MILCAIILTKDCKWGCNMLASFRNLSWMYKLWGSSSRGLHSIHLNSDQVCLNCWNIVKCKHMEFAHGMKLWVIFMRMSPTSVSVEKHYIIESCFVYQDIHCDCYRSMINSSVILNFTTFKYFWVTCPQRKALIADQSL